ncbi:MAG: esterase [Clostridia bacterium]|nr:esterase [Clostridia bacterium]
MKTLEFGNIASDNVLIQPVDEHDLEGIENELAYITAAYGEDFRLIALKVDDWNNALSPWESPAVFGKENFGSGAPDTLKIITIICSDRNKNYYIGGYSLAGLFALWSAYQTELFSGVAAASPSVWFSDFTDYMKENKIQANTVYLSLGNKEEKTRNQVMATVGEKIREAYALLKEQGVNCVLEWNEGNHFKDADIRTAKAFTWILTQKK